MSKKKNKAHIKISKYFRNSDGSSVWEARTKDKWFTDSDFFQVCEAARREYLGKKPNKEWFQPSKLLGW